MESPHYETGSQDEVVILATESKVPPFLTRMSSLVWMTSSELFFNECETKMPSLKLMVSFLLINGPDHHAVFKDYFDAVFDRFR